jgi:hypothetical protein
MFPQIRVVLYNTTTEILGDEPLSKRVNNPITGRGEL